MCDADTDYNLTVPKFGGSTTTNNRSKVSATDRAVVCSRSVGGDYQLYVRVERLDNAVRSDWGTINDLTRRELTYTAAAAGQSYHIRFSTGSFTPVDVQGLGKWSPDNPGVCGF
jgi:hypothetical protein